MKPVGSHTKMVFYHADYESDIIFCLYEIYLCFFTYLISKNLAFITLLIFFI
uniref:Uncharacterized protein n=1 Tax=Meloidogyne enterolobii TaxID=390850 RepID=A0A6V7XEN3_MELEN|nr:unnamed protein product [Meloidogyne enterolobii]